MGWGRQEAYTLYSEQRVESGGSYFFKEDTHFVYISIFLLTSSAIPVLGVLVWNT